MNTEAFELPDDDVYLAQVYTSCVGTFTYEHMLIFDSFARQVYSQFTDNFKLKYHTWSHARHVVIDSNMLACGSVDPDHLATLALAAMFHDVVYVPGAEANSNEKSSAKLLVDFATRTWALTKRQSDLVGEAAILIQATKLSNHMSAERSSSLLEAALLDADLKPLARPYRFFYRAQRHVRVELGLRSDKDTCQHHWDFFQSLLGAREFLYHTDFARRLWEPEARKNISRWGREHGFK